MAHDLATFRISFPEFAGADDPFVQAWLDRAEARCGVARWGAKRDDGIFFLAAHLMAVSPWGNSAKLITSPKEKGYQRTTYGLEYWTLALSISAGARVA
jgi:hypothetical protein